MLHSASWPIDNNFDLVPVITWENPNPNPDPNPTLTLTQVIAWETALGLISGTSKAFAWPVPHDTASVQRRSDPTPAALEVVAVWPRRVVRVKSKPGRGDSSEGEQLVLTAGARWMKREELLRLEWAALRCEAARSGGAGNGAGSRFRLLTQRLASAAAPHDPGAAAAILRSMLRTGGFATHAPELPLLALADELRERGVPRASALPAAAAALVRRDRLFALSLFFGVPMIDRTRTLQGALRTVAASAPPPSRSEADAYRRRIFAGAAGWDATAAAWEPTEGEPYAAHGGELASEICHRELDAAMMARARELWAEADGASPPAQVRVMWSGGIDSTAALVSLLRAAGEGNGGRAHRLVVVLDDESRAEYPRFYRETIAGRLREEPRDERSVSAIDGGGGPVVTGELGDQLFGSDMCSKAFPEGRAGHALEQELFARQAGAAADAERPKADRHFDAGLAAPWTTTLLPALNELGLLPGGDAAAWEAWIAPQLEVTRTRSLTL